MPIIISCSFSISRFKTSKHVQCFKRVLWNSAWSCTKFKLSDFSLFQIYSMLSISIQFNSNARCYSEIITRLLHDNYIWWNDRKLLVYTLTRAKSAINWIWWLSVYFIYILSRQKIDENRTFSLWLTMVIYV